tara:strand:+ start:125 stop:454 length:330 start_codon:yes stop_codon:yes gene_type:complete
MKNLKIYILMKLILIFLLSCSSVKDGFSNQKKSNSDEFLVEKKSPLIMPPDYEELPLPKTETEQNNNNNGEEIIKSLINKQSDNSTVQDKQNSSIQELEKNILNKIKKN